VSYTYDHAGRRTSLTVAGQPTGSYTYDAETFGCLAGCWKSRSRFDSALRATLSTNG